jgi:hypothetical protein
METLMSWIKYDTRLEIIKVIYEFTTLEPDLLHADTV